MKLRTANKVLGRAYSGESYRTTTVVEAWRVFQRSKEARERRKRMAQLLDGCKDYARQSNDELAS